ncbi:hypothetical protein V5O48_006051 [Marasmius crinis-equi]|uniref:F-box domain-containing protein n=1 Tax=Marasmius crinis-equi TaxID=585013 RepID=A0ABR3FKS6_9AGAR
MSTSTRGDLRCRLPFELVDLVLKDCETATLYSCSLVCRSWLPICRSQLFESLEINNTPPQRCVQLVSVLELKHSTISGYIRNLTIHLSNRNRQMISQVPCSRRSDGGKIRLRCVDYIQMILLHLKSSIRSLKKLTIISHPNLLSDFYFSTVSSGIISLASDLTSSFGHIVQELVLQFVEENPLYIIPFICSFPRLEILSMRSGLSANLNPFLDTLLSNHSLPASLRTLKLGDGNDSVEQDGIHSLYRWLRAHCPSELRSLSVENVRLDEVTSPDMRPLLAQCKDLRSLHLGIDTSDIPGNEEPFYDLSAAESLERLAISTRGIELFEPDSTLLTLISQMIDTLASSRLRSITFNVPGGGFRVLDEKWDILDALLASKKFASIAVELVVPFCDLTRNDGTEAEDLPSARRLLTRCDEQARLTVIRAPFVFVMNTSRWIKEGGDEEECIPDWEVIDWVCEGSWRR